MTQELEPSCALLPALYRDHGMITTDVGWMDGWMIIVSATGIAKIRQLLLEVGAQERWLVRAHWTSVMQFRNVETERHVWRF